MLFRFFSRKKSAFHPSDTQAKGVNSEEQNGTYSKKSSAEFVLPFVSSSGPKLFPTSATSEIFEDKKTGVSGEGWSKVAIPPQTAAKNGHATTKAKPAESAPKLPPRTNLNQVLGNVGAQAPQTGQNSTLAKLGSLVTVGTDMKKDRRISYSSPGSPACPEITDQGEDWVRLRWHPPDDDGGLQVSSYHLEKKDSRMRVWLSMSVQLSGTDTCATLTSLRDDSSYEFRVSASNRVGKGPPSPSVPLIRYTDS